MDGIDFIGKNDSIALTVHSHLCAMIRAVKKTLRNQGPADTQDVCCNLT